MNISNEFMGSQWVILKRERECCQNGFCEEFLSEDSERDKRQIGGEGVVIEGAAFGWCAS